MAKLTEHDRQTYAEQVAAYQQQIDALLIREKNMLTVIEGDQTGAAYKKLMLADEMLFLATLYLAKHNLSVSGFNISYSASGFKFACQMGDKDELGDADPKLAENTRRYGFWFGLMVADLGKPFTFNGETVTFEGLKDKKQAIYRRKDGKRYRVEAVRFATANGRSGSAHALADFGA